MMTNQTLQNITDQMEGFIQTFYNLETNLTNSIKDMRIQEIDSIATNTPNFWENKSLSADLLKEQKILQTHRAHALQLRQQIQDWQTYIDMYAEMPDEGLLSDMHALVTEFGTTIEKIEQENLFKDPLDVCDVIVSIAAGAGGTEACDWAQMVSRMLQRYCENIGLDTELIDYLDGDSVGIRNATFTAKGVFAYGFLKSEVGVHRLVRISPFDANKKRHTSFCSVFVTPIIEDTNQVSINLQDLRIDTYRASGAGGQHVNRTDSAVRITHIPTGVVVQSQSQRSQVQNKETCLTLLRSKLVELEREKQKSQLESQLGTKLNNSFGSQIRSYVLHPYQMVKDARTQYQTSQTTQVLDGELQKFNIEYLKQGF
jgi:peptide chain release factor 2